MKIGFGAMVNDIVRFDMVLRQSELPGAVQVVKAPESATVGLNLLLDRLEAAGADVAALVHQDMYFRHGWTEQVESQLALLPPSWIVAGVVGKDLRGRICGRFHDMRIPRSFNTEDIHTFPQAACCFDECVILVNLASGFRFDTRLTGFDLYGTLCVLQAWRMGGTAWVLDAYCEHYCLRPFTWYPDPAFCANFKWLYEEFPEAPRVDTTVLGVPQELDGERCEDLPDALAQQITEHATALPTT